MKTKVQQLNNRYNDIEKEMFWGLLTILFILSLLYAYFINDTVLNIVERKNTNNEIRILSSNVSELESEYFSLSNKIDIPLAYSMGFKDALKYTEYASRKALVKHLSINKNEL